MEKSNKCAKSSINLHHLQNQLTSLSDRLLIYIQTPAQLSYISVLLPSINRSVVLICNFKIIDSSRLPLHQGISCIEFICEGTSVYGQENVDFTFSDNPTLSEKILFYIHCLHPEGIILLSGASEEEQTWRSLAKKEHIKTLQLYDGYSYVVKPANCDEEIRWEQTGSLMTGKTYKKEDILMISLQEKSNRYESALIDLIQQLIERYPTLEFYVLLQEEIDFSEEMIKKVLYQWSNVYLKSIQFWPHLLCKSKVMVSDNLSLLSQAAECNCWTIQYHWNKTEKIQEWIIDESAGNFLESSDPIATTNRLLNEKIPYCNDQVSKLQKLHIGCGRTPLEGWINTDLCINESIKYLDASRIFPFKAETFQYIFSEHLFEHLQVSQGISMLAECYRILKIGGKIRLTMPDLEFLIRMYNHPDEPLHRQYIEWSLTNFNPFVAGLFPDKDYPMAFIVNNFIQFWGHQMVYDKSTIKLLLERSGFKQIVFMESGKSETPELQNIESHGKMIPEWANLLESMTVEACKMD